MRIVVTGASGFLGRALMRKLTRNGIEVIGVSRHRLPGLAQVASYADAPGGDVLVHLAEVSDRKWVETNGAYYAQAAYETLDSLLEKGFDRVVYSSSAVLYGDQCETLRRVEEPVHVVDIYTRLKYESELSVLRRKGVVARLVNIYGPSMSEKNVLSAILKQIPLDGPIRVLDVTPIRDFLWIEDAAEALAIMSLGKASGIFNVGTGLGTSILELAHIVLNAAEQTGRSVESGHQDTRHSHLVVDIAQTVAEFGWRPTTTLQNGIETLVNMIKEQHE
ncbi:MAG: NAD(P)-dependent oxidoreductase [Nitrospira sp.]|nr:NAD(P)-dependent oxidoreductase [Nitrospira sp.]